MRYFSVLLLAIFSTTLIIGCDSLGNQREPYSEPSQQEPELLPPSVLAQCDTDSTKAFAEITIRANTDSLSNISLEVFKESNDSLVATFSGLESNSEVEIDSLPGNGNYRAKASANGLESKSSNFSVDCVILPGNIEVTRNTCVQGSDKKFDGEVTIETEDELESWELDNLDTGQVVRSDSSASGSKVEFEDLPDAEYEFRAVTVKGAVDTVFLVSCDRSGPGQATVSTTCNGEDGTITGSTENGFSKAELLDENGNVIDTKTGFDPENADAEVEFTSVDDGTYQIRFHRYGRTVTSSEVVVSCDGPTQPSLADKRCESEQGVLEFEVDPDAESWELRRSDDDSVVRSGDITDDMVEVDDLDDGEYYLQIQKNNKTSRSEDITVSCDRKVRRCTFSFTENVFVSGDAKHNEVCIDPSKAVVIHSKDDIFADVTLQVRARMEEGESFFVELRPVDGGDVIRSDRFERPDDVGPGDTWISSDKLKQTIPLEEFTVGKKYEVCFITGDPNGHRNSVWFSDENRDGRVVLKYEFRGTAKSKSVLGGDTKLIPASQTDIGMPVLETKVQAKVIKK